MTEPNATHRDTASLSPEKWAHVRALVEETLALAPEARPSFLDASCAGDHELRSRVERLAAACERAGESWGFLEHPAGELVAPLLAAAVNPLAERRLAEMADRLARLRTALGSNYRVERELGAGGMATVYLAHDIRHERQVAIKVLHPEASAVLGAERFLSEIKTTAALQHPHIVPLFDSGTADGLLFYVMPLVEGETLRARLTQEKQLPVAEAVRIASEVAAGLDYAHRRGVIHRDIKPENILLHEGRPLITDFGIALALQSARAERMTQPGLSLGTPHYMSPEQSTGEQEITARSDIYALGVVTYEMLTGELPFTGATVQQVLARVRSEEPRAIITQRKHVAPHVEAAVLTALEKLPADRFESAGGFGRALSDPGFRGPSPARASSRAPAARWRNPVRVMLGAAATIGLASAAWIASRESAAPVSRFVERNLIDQTFRGAIAITPDGRALLYTGSSEAGRPIVLRPLDQRPERALAGTEGGAQPFVAPDGRRIALVSSDGSLRTLSIDAGAAADGAVSRVLRRIRGKAGGWRYGNGAWVGDGAIVTDIGARGLLKHDPARGAPAVLTQVDTARGESKHLAPLLLPGTRVVVFTVSDRRGFTGLVAGQLAIASLDPGTASVPPHVLLGVEARRAVAFVDGWLLFTSADGTAIRAVRLDPVRRRISGTEIPVLEDELGNLETASLADDGTLLYVRRPRTNSPVLVDVSGAVHPGFAGVEGSFMHPRISPDGKRFAVQVTAAGRADVWLYDIASRTPMQLTTTGNALHPTWTPDGRDIVYLALTGSRRLEWATTLWSQPVDGGAPRRVQGTDGVMTPTVTPDGRSVVFQRGFTAGWSIWSAPLSGAGPARKVLDDTSAHYMPAVSPDGRALAYVSSASGRDEVYARAFPGRGPAVQISDGGGTEPAWSPDGRRIYYRSKGAFMAVVLARPGLAITSRRHLFKDAFDASMPHRNYDVAPDGKGLVMITTGNPEAVVVLNWLTALRARLARAS